MSAYNVLFEEVMEYNFNKIEDEFFTESLSESLNTNPLGKFRQLITDIRENKPTKYSDNKEVEEFVDKNYNDIMEASKILEKEPDKLKQSEINMLIRVTMEFLAMIAGVALGSKLIVFASYIIFIVDGLLSPIILYIRGKNDTDTYNKLLQIKKSLEKVSNKKLSKSAKKKIDMMIDKIDDVDITLAGRQRSVKESTNDKLDEIKLLVYESCYQGDITIEEKDILLSFVSESCKSISEIEKIYSCELDDDIKEVLNTKYESKKFKTLRRVSINEIKDSEKDLGIDFISNKIIPIFDVGDNDFIIYEISSKSFALFNITDSTTFKKRKNIKDIL